MSRSPEFLIITFFAGYCFIVEEKIPQMPRYFAGSSQWLNFVRIFLVYFWFKGGTRDVVFLKFSVILGFSTDSLVHPKCRYYRWQDGAIFVASSAHLCLIHTARIPGQEIVSSPWNCWLAYQGLALGGFWFTSHFYQGEVSQRDRILPSIRVAY